MKTILVIGIGAGNPDHITIQAIDALNQVDVFFVLDKGPDKDKLAALRRDICQRFIKHDRYRVAEAPNPERDRDPADYRSAVVDANREKTLVFEQLIAEEMKDGECGRLPRLGRSLALRPAPSASCRRWWTAGRHGHRVRGHPRHHQRAGAGRPAQDHAQPDRPGVRGDHRPPPRRGLPGRPPQRGGHAGCEQHLSKQFADQDIDIFWGAYVGTPDEILVAGKLRDVAGDIDRIRTEARTANGWIMDSYIMHRASGDEEG